MQRNDNLHGDLIELGVASNETKGSPVVGEPDTIELQKFGAGIADD